MSAERSEYEARQAELLASLISGDGFPSGFVADDAAAASRALRAKRGRAVRVAWPGLAAALGDEFAARFDAYARGGAGPPPEGGGLADGLGLARSVDQPPDDAVRVEILFARAALAGTARTPRWRRGPFAGAITLREPRRLLVVVGLRGATGRLVIPFGR